MCQCDRHKNADSGQLVTEAITVGVALVPVFIAVSRLTAVMDIGRGTEWKALMDTALSGALFHLVAEETGLNAWYLTNSHAARQALLHSLPVDGTGRRDTDDVLGWLSGPLQLDAS